MTNGLSMTKRSRGGRLWRKLKRNVGAAIFIARIILWVIAASINRIWGIAAGAKVADKHNTCGLWCRNHWSRSMRKQVALRSLLEILQNLEHVRIILEEEHEMNKTDPLE